MRHGKKFNHLSRPAGHRKALLSGLAKSLIIHKRINTTLAKAKALRKFVEPILTKTKTDTTHSRRVVFSYFQDKVPVKELFDSIAAKIAERPGGYTRIIRTGNRLGDNAEMCMIELVDYNELYQKQDNAAKSSRTRRGKSKAKELAQEAPQLVAVESIPAEEAAVEVVANEEVVLEEGKKSTEKAQAEATNTLPDTTAKEENKQDA